MHVVGKKINKSSREVISDLFLAYIKNGETAYIKNVETINVTKVIRLRTGKIDA